MLQGLTQERHVEWVIGKSAAWRRSHGGGRGLWGAGSETRVRKLAAIIQVTDGRAGRRRDRISCSDTMGQEEEPRFLA